MNSITKQKVTAVFDIGKTNKKFFLFDSKYREVYKEYIQFDEIIDEDGFPTEDLQALQNWIESLFASVLTSEKYIVKAINFSTYGASFVHLDKKGKVLTPLYNYLKPLPQEIIESFDQTYGDISEATGAPGSGMLNSGLQLYWLKRTKPKIFEKIKYSLHFPQYISYLFTGIPLSEYTSLGCHTALWDLDKKDYHDWVYKEKIDEKFPPIVSTRTSINMVYKKNNIKIGVGIHDSSSALLPYIYSERSPFLLVSTGTWSVTLNPFNATKLTREDIENNCLNYMQIDGGRIKATRFFMGYEYKLQVKKLSEFFDKKFGYHRTVKFDLKIYSKLIKNKDNKFNFEGIQIRKNNVDKTNFSQFGSFEEGFHQLMIELIQLQKSRVKMAISNSKIKIIYLEGGFIDNDIFVNLMGHHFRDYKVISTKSPLGSALGAAMVISKKEVNKKFLKENYQLKKLYPLKLAIE